MNSRFGVRKVNLGSREFERCELLRQRVKKCARKLTDESDKRLKVEVLNICCDSRISLQSSGVLLPSLLTCM